MGYRTHQTLPNLPNRVLIVDDRFKTVNHSDEWCIGGKKTYEKYCHMFTELHISHINDYTIGDVVFPDLSNLNPSCKIFNWLLFVASYFATELVNSTNFRNGTRWWRRVWIVSV